MAAALSFIFALPLFSALLIYTRFGCVCVRIIRVTFNLADVFEQTHYLTKFTLHFCWPWGTIATIPRWLREQLTFFTGGDAAASGWALASLMAGLVACTIWFELKTYFLFIWHCFIVPLGKTADQKARLDKASYISELSFALAPSSIIRNVHADVSVVYLPLGFLTGSSIKGRRECMIRQGLVFCVVGTRCSP
jgi:hypothetical protein